MTISEISKIYDLSQDTLRYYERIGLIPTIKRTNSGIRDYSEDDCRWIEFIKCMRGAGLTIEILIEYVSLFQEGESTESLRKDLLIEQRDLLVKKMEEMKKTIERLNHKIEIYDESLSKKEKILSKN